ncbi:MULTISPECIES: (Na+)-NQR maturation NqrM [Moraxella]|uniref:(Na+)-NQR maturation NqrM n=1 Tax=Moraxella nasicaprae TaxID=2904122 RepID=A0ABY6F6M6_9GAMM|nr:MULTISPECIES: (Na+)-NQR maturation NqrM [Moraxella]MDO4894839.1 (Na+)-NQR maturation NqrM [Moraxella sp.]UXZ05754.1 (Na+)-NQR maturation NqrM [Moraxella nasicaprae]
MSDILSQFLPILAVTFGVFLLFFLFMGVGYLVKKQPLKGSCGGVANLMGDEYCQFCGNDPNKCESQAKLSPEIQHKAQAISKSA